MGNKIRKFLNNFVKRDKLRVQVVLLTLILVLVSAIPVNLFSIYNELQLTTQREFESMFSRVEKIQDKIVSSGIGASQELDSEFFKQISYPGESMKIRMGEQGAHDYHYAAEYEQNDKFGMFEAQILTLFVPTFFDSIKAHMRSLDATADKDSYSFYIDEKNKAYGEILHSFKHKGHYDTIIIKKDITPNLKMQMVNSMENFLYMFIWFFFFSVVSVLVCLKFIFKPLQSAIDSSFENVVDNNYQTRIEDPLYGEEISKIVHRFNAVLDRMHELVQNNLNSMQDVSHEIKTYLTAIKQSVDVIKIYGKSDDKLVAEKLNAIEDNIIRGTAIISTTLELARLKQIPNIDSANYYDVKYLVNFLLRFKQETYPSFIFETDYDSEEVEIFIDRNHFFLMMNPILDNAVKYSMNSNIVKIDTISKRTDNMVYISITNTGVVIDQKEIPFLFDRYYRGKNLGNSKQGSGLGLTIAKEVMNLYKGRITVHGTADGVTSFILSFPKAIRREDSGNLS